MRIRSIAAATVAAALAVPALAQAQPNRHQVGALVPAGSSLNLTFGTVPKGQFAFGLKVSSDGEKTLRLSQKRDNGSRFTVLQLPSGAAADACQGAAGTVVCTNITTPVTPGGHSPRHSHDYEHEVFIVSGSGTVLLEGRENPVRSGDVVYVPADEEHQFRAGPDGLRFLCLVPVSRNCGEPTPGS